MIASPTLKHLLMSAAEDILIKISFDISCDCLLGKQNKI